VRASGSRDSVSDSAGECDLWGPAARRLRKGTHHRGRGSPAPPRAATAHRCPPAAFTIATIPARTAWGRSAHAATTADRSGSAGVAGVAGVPEPARMLPDLLPPESETCEIPRESGGSSVPSAPT
jgi:hypothetical protein